MTPPNFGSGAGSWVLGTVVVALGEPSVPVTCCATAGKAVIAVMASAASAARQYV
jgi:hypothetical protein